MQILPPKFTTTGFKKIKIPHDLQEKIMGEYENMSFNEIVSDVSYTPLWGNTVFGVSNLEEDKKFYYKDSISESLYQDCYDTITPIIEEWCGVKLEKTWGYGVRSYTKNSILKLHRDRVDTHVISCIVFIDEKSKHQWPLDFFDHNHHHHEVTFEPGEMLLYESLCVHGRITPFSGEYYRNMYFHWKPVNWNHSGYSNLKSTFKNLNEYLNYYK